MPKTEVESITQIKTVAPSRLPNGDYPGVWGGYVVNVTIGGKAYRMETTNGIRTMRADCVVHVRDGVVTAEVENG